jgi:hypothetical protein
MSHHPYLCSFHATFRQLRLYVMSTTCAKVAWKDVQRLASVTLTAEALVGGRSCRFSWHAGPNGSCLCQNTMWPTAVGNPESVGGVAVSDNKKSDGSEIADSNDATGDADSGGQYQGTGQSGPTFTKGPDPLAGVRKSAGDVMASMEGKTVSMKVYIGTIAAVIILMLLARCGG